jgi:hypothetical protein
VLGRIVVEDGKQIPRGLNGVRRPYSFGGLPCEAAGAYENQGTASQGFRNPTMLIEPNMVAITERRPDRINRRC